MSTTAPRETWSGGPITLRAHAPCRPRRAARRVSTGLLLLLLLAAAAPARARGAPTPIDASVVLLFMSDTDGGAASACARMARRAAASGGRAVNFVVTGYYRTDGTPRMTDVGYKESEADRELRPFTWDAAQRLAHGLTECMRVAAAGGASLAAHIHLDDADDAGTWRNALDFEPFTRYGQLSYWEALVRPTAQALATAGVARRPVYLGVQAEMGATLFYYPAAYRSMVSQIKATAAAAGMPPGDVRVGANLNWEKVCGCPAGLLYSTRYMSELPAHWGEVKARVPLGELQALFRALDWVGVSAYAPLPLDPTPADLEASLAQADRELRLFGVDLRALNKELIYSEYGVGGGAAADLRCPAPSAGAAAASPYWGVAGRYAAGRDPWAAPGNRAFLRRFYNTTIDFAAAGGGPNYRVSAIFLWSIISYDVTGVHYFSTSPEGSYRDDVIVAAVQAHNARVRAAASVAEQAAPPQAAAPAQAGAAAALPEGSEGQSMAAAAAAEGAEGTLEGGAAGAAAARRRDGTLQQEQQQRSPAPLAGTAPRRNATPAHSAHPPPARPPPPLPPPPQPAWRRWVGLG